MVGDPLLHSINVADSKALIYGHDFLKGTAYLLINLEFFNFIWILAIKDVSDKLKHCKIYQLNSNNSNTPLLEGAVGLSDAIEGISVSQTDLEKDMEIGRPRDKLIYVYTSGTTGLPKAAVITHLRLVYNGYTDTLFQKM